MQEGKCGWAPLTGSGREGGVSGVLPQHGCLTACRKKICSGIKNKTNRFMHISYIRGDEKIDSVKVYLGQISKGRVLWSSGLC